MGSDPGQCVSVCKSKVTDWTDTRAYGGYTQDPCCGKLFIKHVLWLTFKCSQVILSGIKVRIKTHTCISTDVWCSQRRGGHVCSVPFFGHHFCP